MINRDELIAKMIFLFRLQETLGQKNYSRFKIEHLRELISAVVVIGVEVLYQSRVPGFEFLNQIDLNKCTQPWKELMEHHFNECILELNDIRNSGYPISLSIPKQQIALQCHMTELVDKLIDHETRKSLQIPGRSDDGPAVEGEDMHGSSQG